MSVKYLIDESTLKALANYLFERPYGQVAGLVKQLERLEMYVPPAVTKEPEAPKEEAKPSEIPKAEPEKKKPPQG